MLAWLFVLASVRPELVEGHPVVERHGRPSTSSGRTEEPRTPVDAERAFATDAQTLGQWAAFRKWATVDATMFAPDPVLAQTWLKDRADPPHAVQWSPTASYQSCDGHMAINTGEWRRADGSVGYFTKVWVEQAAGWRWMLDHGDALDTSRPRVAQPVVRRASCGGRPTSPWGVFPQYRWAGLNAGGGHPTNPTLAYSYHANGRGQHDLILALWTGARWEVVISDHVAPATP